MRLPILVLCLAVAYGTCKIYGETNVDLIDSVRNDKSDYSVVPVEVALSRHRRSILSPSVKLVLRMLGLGDNKVIQGIVNFVDFVNGVLNGQLDFCPKTEQLSIPGFIKNVFLHPIGTLENVLCRVANIIGREGLAVVRTILQILSQFIRKIFLPKLHMTLNLMLKTHLVPPQIAALIQMFNVFYGFLKLIGYVSA